MIIGTKIWRCRGCSRSWLETEEAFAEAIAEMKEDVEMEMDVDEAMLVFAPTVEVQVNMYSVKIYKVELLILNALVNPKSKEGIFTILLTKYDELLRDGMEIREKLVKENKLEEAAYMRFCKNSCSSRGRILKLVKSWIITDGRE